jgi:hypothetical protein
MHHRARLASSLSLLAALSQGCASSISTSQDPVADAGADAAPSIAPDAAPVTAPDGGVCPPRVELPPSPACAGLAELASPANAVPGVSDAYALGGLRPARNDARAACVAEPWQDRADARLRFTAPRGGRWRFTASGVELWALDLRRGCAVAAGCVGSPDVHGPHASSVLVTDVQVQRGESIGLTLDGCPVGTDCRYALRVERIADLACEFGFPTPAVCAGEREVCSVDACDRERFACRTVATRAPTLSSLRVFADEAGERTAYEGRALLGDPSESGRSGTLMGRWLDAGGATLGDAYLGQAAIGPDGAFSGITREAPRGAVRGVFRFYDTARPEWEGGVEVTIERWAPPAEGAACSEAMLSSRCDTGLRCVTAGGSGVCRRVTAIEVTGLRAWRDDVAGSLRLAVAGLGTGRQLSRLSVELLDAGGRALVSAPSVATVFQTEQPSGVSFSTSMEVSNDPLVYRPAGFDRAFRVTPAVVRVRVAAIDTSEQRSAPVEAAVLATTAAGLGASCDDPAVACAAGLACARPSGTSQRRCEPTRTPRACWMPDGVPTWAPPAAAGTYTVEGAAHGTGGGPRCYVGRTQRVSAMEFVAPVTGRYAFELRGMKAMSVGTSCEASACELAPEGSSEVRVTVALMAGQRVPLEMSSERELVGPAVFTLSVQVP